MSISKRYWCSCEHCLKVYDLLSQNTKDCEEELRQDRWKKLRGNWYCNECLTENSKQELHGYGRGNNGRKN